MMKNKSLKPSNIQFHQPVRIFPINGSSLASPFCFFILAARHGVTAIVTHNEKAVAYTIVTA